MPTLPRGVIRILSPTFIPPSCVAKDIYCELNDGLLDAVLTTVIAVKAPSYNPNANDAFLFPAAWFVANVLKTLFDEVEL